MSLVSRRRINKRSMSPVTIRFSSCSAPYKREQQRGFSQGILCKNCRRPGHFVREYPNVAVCHNCGLRGHIASECTTKSFCWNCREPGHTASSCRKEGVCNRRCKAGHEAHDCAAPPMPPRDVRLCNNCEKQGHLAAQCTNDRACNNCRRTGHLARDCLHDPICNLCNLSGHVARGCPKVGILAERGGGGGGGRGGGRRRRGIRAGRNCQLLGHMSRDCRTPLVCTSCGEEGHLEIECPFGGFEGQRWRRDGGGTW